MGGGGGGGGGIRPDPQPGLRPLIPHQGLRPWTRALPPYTPSFQLYTRPSRIRDGGFSSLCVYSLCRTLCTELHKIAYETRAYFFTHGCAPITVTFDYFSSTVLPCCIIYYSVRTLELTLLITFRTFNREN